MSEIPDGLLYSEEHEYLKPTDTEGEYLVGITDYAQGELGDIVYVEFPSAGDTFDRMDSFGVIEAVKAVNDLYSPVSAEVLEVNESLQDDPSLVNSDPYGDGWMIRVRVLDESELDSLLDPGEYAEQLGE
ncbi:MAG: glycine cleavage system protein GcvH [Longimicrobiales bacterium]|nr:glycine cleavage system protein GcvH [Longimicrobiales bacterium]